MKRRAKQVKAVQRRIVFRVSGRAVKTVRDKLTHARAVRECGADPFLCKGDRHRVRRRFGAAVVVELEYELLVSLVGGGDTYHLGTGDAKAIVRGGMVG